MSSKMQETIYPKLSAGYKECFVPLCNNNTKNSPHKVFIHVLQDQKRKKIWFAMARRKDSPTSTHRYCCEDHINLEEDLENFMRFKLYGAPVRIKANVFPRFFDCQPDRKRAATTSPRESLWNIKHRKEIKDILDEENRNKENVSGSINIAEEKVLDFNAESNDLLQDIGVNINTQQEQASAHESSTIVRVKQEKNCESSSSAPLKKKYRSIGVSVNIRNPFRSIGIMCKDKTADKSCDTNDIQFASFEQAEKLPCASDISLPVNKIIQLESDLGSSVVSEIPTSGSEYKPSSGEQKELEECDIEINRTALKMINYFISNNPKRYIGVPPDWTWVLEKLSVSTKIGIDDIKLTLMKIKLNDTYVRLGNQFGISSTKASSIFNKSVIALGNILDSFIYFPSKKNVLRAIPIPFRANYYNVQSIIDAFEIEIEKPSNPVNQSLTWSEYKKCNTLKYFISCSPDGFINFISTGYGGRISDKNLFEICGILEKLPENCTIMGDRGFKQMETLLIEKNCKLVRPPSVTANQKLCKKEAKEAKQISSLRIHIERVINRLREFELLVPHSCISYYMLPYIDSLVRIAAALSNMQSPIIKT